MALSHHLGARIRRREDPRLVTGSGTYVDDVRVPGVAHVAFVRSYLAHARVRGLDTGRAEKAPGVLQVVTARTLPEIPKIPISGPEGTRLPDRRALNGDRARFVGDLLAAVVAETREQARDAADEVVLDLEPLPAIIDAERARAADAPLVHEGLQTNIASESSRIFGDIEAAFRDAARVMRIRLRNQRVAAVPIEPRGILAVPHLWEASITVWDSTQIPHRMRDEIASFLGLPQGAVRVIAPDVGGGFGAKLSLFPEELLVPWLAMRLRRPLKWIEERSEHMVATTHGRDQLHEAELALEADGRVRGLRVRILADLGAYPLGALIPQLTARLVSGCYRVPALQVEVSSVYTHKTPTAAYRGAGRPEAIFLIERLMDRAARELGLDPVEMRRRNLMPRFDVPTQNVAEQLYDSGDYPAALDRALAIVDYPACRKEQARLTELGELMGIGVACYVEMAGFGPSGGLFESATVRAHPDGKVVVLSGTSPQGQGHATAWVQIVAAQLGIPLDDVIVQQGDTAAVAIGVGTFGSRSAAVGGTAVHVATIDVQEKARLIAAHLLEAAPADIVASNGRLQVRGVPSRSVTFSEVAGAAYTRRLPDIEPGLEATRYFQPPGLVYPFGAHVAVVRIDRETGAVRVDRYVSVDDCGRVLNPLLAEGQVHGSLAQGLAQALMEEVRYGPEGELLTGNLTTYLAPCAPDLPSFTLDRTVTPTSMNPLGVKGIGESATIGSTPAVVNAVLDALAPLGIHELDMPCAPQKVWQALRPKL